MNKMERINKKLGFGLMRLPMKDGEVDIEQTCLMVDEFIKAGFNYFDTAHGYLSGKSEKAAKTCLTSRYPRESFILTNKLTDEYFKTNDDIRPFFESQLELCGVDYFDFYLMHAQNEARFRYFKERNAYETAIELKKEGKIRHFGISFHDRAEVLDAILSEYPQIEVVYVGDLSNPKYKILPTCHILIQALDSLSIELSNLSHTLLLFLETEVARTIYLPKHR